MLAKLLKALTNNIFSGAEIYPQYIAPANGPEVHSAVLLDSVFQTQETLSSNSLPDSSTHSLEQFNHLSNDPQKFTFTGTFTNNPLPNIEIYNSNPGNDNSKLTFNEYNTLANTQKATLTSDSAIQFNNVLHNPEHAYSNIVAEEADTESNLFSEEPINQAQNTKIQLFNIQKEHDTDTHTFLPAFTPGKTSSNPGQQIVELKSSVFDNTVKQSLEKITRVSMKI
jgi:hypothetical protein